MYNETGVLLRWTPVGPTLMERGNGATATGGSAELEEEGATLSSKKPLVSTYLATQPLSAFKAVRLKNN